jgi:hypothetical protein
VIPNRDFLKQDLTMKTFVGTSENALRIQIWTELISRHGTDTKHVKFDVLPGTTAGVSVNPWKIEILVPLNQYLLRAQSIEDVRLALLKLDVSAKDQVRIFAAPHIDFKQEKKTRFDLRPAERRGNGIGRFY